MLVVLWLIVEEWLWDAMLAFTSWMGKLPPIRWVEQFIARLPPYLALLAFLVPALFLLPFKLAAFWLIAQGHGAYGLWVFIIAKIVGTALLARIFALTRHALLTIAWFARAYHAVLGWKATLYRRVRLLPAWRRARALMLAARRRASIWWRQLFGGHGR